MKIYINNDLPQDEEDIQEQSYKQFSDDASSFVFANRRHHSLDEEAIVDKATNNNGRSGHVTDNSSRQVDKKIFLPLYIVTACILLFPVLPLALRVFLIATWAILFVWTPLYYLYYYDPDNNAKYLPGCCQGEDTTVRT